MTARRILKWVLWALASVFVLALALYLIVRVVNRHDEAPSTAVLRFEAVLRNLPPVADEDNALFYFLGMPAPPTDDPAVAGVRRAALMQAGVRAAVVEQSYDLNKARSAKVKALLTGCRQMDSACRTSLEENIALIEGLLKDEQWLASRYKTLMAFPKWREQHPKNVANPVIEFAMPLEGQKNLLLNAWLRAGKGDVEGVRKLIEEDMHFWRRNLSESDMLLSKVIFASAVARNLTWGTVILNRLPSGLAAKAVPAQWREPLTVTERSMLRALAGEWRLNEANLKLIDISPLNDSADAADMAPLLLPLIRPTFQRQATSNRQAEFLAALADAAALEYEKLPMALQRSRGVEARTGTLLVSDAGYNLMGNLILGAGSGTYSKYPAMVSDLEGVRRAALLAVQLRSEGVPAAQVQERLRKSDLKDPYDHRSFVWNDEAHAIVVTGLVEGERGRKLILY